MSTIRPSLRDFSVHKHFSKRSSSHNIMINVDLSRVMAILLSIFVFPRTTVIPIRGWMVEDDVLMIRAGAGFDFWIIRLVRSVEE